MITRGHIRGPDWLMNDALENLYDLDDAAQRAWCDEGEQAPVWAWSA